MANLDEDIRRYREAMKEKLKPSRYEHSLSVSYMCVALAMRYGYDLKKAETAGILHDCAKRFSDSELVEKCREHGIPLTEEELASPAVIHAKYGAWLAWHKYGIKDEEILSAIACHTTGKIGMGLLDKILYVADYIEPRRDKAENLTGIRKLAFTHLDRAMYEIARGTLAYLRREGAAIDPMTEEVCRYFKDLTEEKDKNRLQNEITEETYGSGCNNGQTGN